MKCQVSRSLISSASIGYRGLIALATSAWGGSEQKIARHLAGLEARCSRYHATANDPPYEDQRRRR